jgi:hypothetical protein
VDRVIDAASGTFVARVELSNADLNVPIGSRCTAEFDIDLTNADLSRALLDEQPRQGQKQRQRSERERRQNPIPKR